MISGAVWILLRMLNSAESQTFEMLHPSGGKVCRKPNNRFTKFYILYFYTVCALYSMKDDYLLL